MIQDQITSRPPAGPMAEKILWLRARLGSLAASMLIGRMQDTDLDVDDILQCVKADCVLLSVNLYAACAWLHMHAQGFARCKTAVT